ncbi:hypothetical protein Pelo_7390 [Pelomyxa schiedti]|nr:hypothetical protein Pelo_7390 [Pelomyxa schiedti]
MGNAVESARPITAARSPSPSSPPPPAAAATTTPTGTTRSPRPERYKALKARYAKVLSRSPDKKKPILRAAVRAAGPAAAARAVAKARGAAAEGGGGGGGGSKGRWQQVWDSGAKWLSVVHMCAGLGHVAELDAVLETWADCNIASGDPDVADDGDTNCSSRESGSGESQSQTGEEENKKKSNRQAEEVKWLVNAVSRKQGFTGLMMAAKEDQWEVAICLMDRWKADIMVCCQYSQDYNGYTVLHICAAKNDSAGASEILSRCNELQRAELVGIVGNEGVGTVLDLALSSGSMGFAEMLTHPRWGPGVVIALDAKAPIRRHRNAPEYVFHWLCSVFSNGLEDAFVYGRRNYRETILQHPEFPSVLNRFTECKPHTTPLFAVAVSGEKELVNRLLSLGASPNTVCEKWPEWEDGRDLPIGQLRQGGINISKIILTPMVIALITDRKQIVQAMSNHGGVLPPEFCQDWSRGDPHFSVATYLDGSWQEHVLANISYTQTLPFPEEHTELCASLSFGDDKLVTAKIPINESITMMMARYNTEISGVLDFLDIQALGRIQQTSRIWYHAGRSNSLWKWALLNTSATWNQATKTKLYRMITTLDQEPTTKWKRVCFFWLSRCFCCRCAQYYRSCEEVVCVASQHRPRAVSPQLQSISTLYNSLHEE